MRKRFLGATAVSLVLIAGAALADAPTETTQPQPNS